METCEKSLKTKTGKDRYMLYPEYRELQGNLKAYQQLFRFRYLENVNSLSRLCGLVGCRDVEEVVSLERNLDAYFRRVMGGVVRSDLLYTVCPECFHLSLTNLDRDGRAIRKTCADCGVEAPDLLTDFDDFTQNLPMTEAFSPESQASYTKGLGETFSPTSHKDHNRYLWYSFNKRNILWVDFKKKFPELARCLETEAYVVRFGDYVFCRVGKFVRKAHVDKYFDYIMKFWHEFDVPLKNKKFRLEITVKNNLKRAKKYATGLLERYGFDDKNRDQAIFNTVGNEIDLLKHQLKVQGRRVSEKRLVNTIFYICLLQFKRCEVAAKVKSELDISLDLVNYYVDFKAFLRRHEKLNGSSSQLVALEQATVMQKIGKA